MHKVIQNTSKLVLRIGDRCEKIYLYLLSFYNNHKTLFNNAYYKIMSHRRGIIIKYLVLCDA